VYVAFSDSLRRLILVDTLFSAEMWQANDDNSNNELRNQFPETWEKIQQVRAQGFNTCSKEYQDANDVSPAFLMFYNAAVFEKLMHSDGSINNEVYCAITGDDADFVVSGDMGKFDFRLDLKKLTVPTLILAGRYDRVAIPRLDGAVQAVRSSGTVCDVREEWPLSVYRRNRRNGPHPARVSEKEIARPKRAMASARMCVSEEFNRGEPKTREVRQKG
jgi:pimeloyl-ACP methyl ester carboxylesterase